MMMITVLCRGMLLKIIIRTPLFPWFYHSLCLLNHIRSLALVSYFINHLHFLHEGNTAAARHLFLSSIL